MTSITARHLVKIAVWLIALGLAPLALAAAADAVGGWAGCNVNEGGVSSCMIGGWDVGELLAIFFVMGWLAIVTLPLAGLGLCVLVAAGLLYIARTFLWRTD